MAAADVIGGDREREEGPLRAVGIVGYKDSGKTTLIQALARELRDRGHKVVVVKHSSHGIDLQGKDTARLRESADQVAFLSPMESAILWKGSRKLEEILPHLDADILLIEGFKTERTFPKIVCLKGEAQDNSLFDSLTICAVGPAHCPEGYRQVEGVNVPLPGRDKIGKIADLVQERAFKLPNLNCGACGYETCYGLALEIVAGSKTIEDCVSLQPATQVRIDGRPLPLNPFTSQIVRNVILAMLSPLKGFSAGEIEVKIS